MTTDGDKNYLSNINNHSKCMVGKPSPLDFKNDPFPLRMQKCDLGVNKVYITSDQNAGSDDIVKIVNPKYPNSYYRLGEDRHKLYFDKECNHKNDALLHRNRKLTIDENREECSQMIVSSKEINNAKVELHIPSGLEGESFTAPKGVFGKRYKRIK